MGLAAQRDALLAQAQSDFPLILCEGSCNIIYKITREEMRNFGAEKTRG
jgi:hypothetical protein